MNNQLLYEHNKHINKEIDIDDIIDDIYEKKTVPDALDIKLARINDLYKKVVADKRRRRRERDARLKDKY